MSSSILTPRRVFRLAVLLRPREGGGRHRVGWLLPRDAPSGDHLQPGTLQTQPRPSGRSEKTKSFVEFVLRGVQGIVFHSELNWLILSESQSTNRIFPVGVFSAALTWDTCSTTDPDPRANATASTRPPWLSGPKTGPPPPPPPWPRAEPPRAEPPRAELRATGRRSSEGHS